MRLLIISCINKDDLALNSLPGLLCDKPYQKKKKKNISRNRTKEKKIDDDAGITSER